MYSSSPSCPSELTHPYHGSKVAVHAATFFYAIINQKKTFCQISTLARTVELHTGHHVQLEQVILHHGKFIQVIFKTDRLPEHGQRIITQGHRQHEATAFRHEIAAQQVVAEFDKRRKGLPLFAPAVTVNQVSHGMTGLLFEQRFIAIARNPKGNEGQVRGFIAGQFQASAKAYPVLGELHAGFKTRPFPVKRNLPDGKTKSRTDPDGTVAHTLVVAAAGHEEEAGIAFPTGQGMAVNGIRHPDGTAEAMGGLRSRTKRKQENNDEEAEDTHDAKTKIQ